MQQELLLAATAPSFLALHAHLTTLVASRAYLPDGHSHQDLEEAAPRAVFRLLALGHRHSFATRLARRILLIFGSLQTTRLLPGLNSLPASDLLIESGRHRLPSAMKVCLQHDRYTVQHGRA
ncbi:hypothetical protein BD626DRAFT_274915 [Schizophyllum amplum]|uniref:Uncharacterized protein n=1 Tax=Schizophyllum amplum TaxID=97359 RepID=A0A550CFT9_9AGAR|nr:hypothetical protein BD626DRAFT_274915 [Auriculariopsis ampla]